MVRSTASIRLIWPSIMFCQVGVLASSKSAMYTSAPELSALMSILRSVGPGQLDPALLQVGVVTGATCQSPSRMWRVSGRKSGSSPASKRAWRSWRACEQRLARRIELAVQPRHEVERGRGQDVVEAGQAGPAHLDAGGGGSRQRH